MSKAEWTRIQDEIRQARRSLQLPDDKLPHLDAVARTGLPFNPYPALPPLAGSEVYEVLHAGEVLVGYAQYGVNDIDQLLECMNIMSGGALDAQIWKIENWMRIAFQLPRWMPTPQVLISAGGFREPPEMTSQDRMAEGLAGKAAPPRWARHRYVPRGFIKQMRSFEIIEKVTFKYPSIHELMNPKFWNAGRYTKMEATARYAADFDLPNGSFQVMAQIHRVWKDVTSARDEMQRLMPRGIFPTRSNPRMEITLDGEVSAFNVMLAGHSLYDGEWMTLEQIQALWTRMAHQQVDIDEVRAACDALVGHGVAESDGDRYRLNLMDVA